MEAFGIQNTGWCPAVELGTGNCPVLRTPPLPPQPGDSGGWSTAWVTTLVQSLCQGKRGTKPTRGIQGNKNSKMYVGIWF